MPRRPTPGPQNSNNNRHSSNNNNNGLLFFFFFLLHHHNHNNSNNNGRHSSSHHSSTNNNINKSVRFVALLLVPLLLMAGTTVAMNTDAVASTTKMTATSTAKVTATSSSSSSLSSLQLLLSSLPKKPHHNNNARQFSALETVNPWLSACDLQPNSATTDDMRGVCSYYHRQQQQHQQQQQHDREAETSDEVDDPVHRWHEIGNHRKSDGNHRNNNNNNHQQQHHRRQKVVQRRSLCPLPCQSSSMTSKTNDHQCLRYLTESHKEEICGRALNRAGRREALEPLRMRHCCEHAVLTTSDRRRGDDEALLNGGDACRDRLAALLEVDALAANVSCKFAEVMSRYDCGQTYSIVHRCEDCKEAYRRWVCSALVPHFDATRGRRVRPCRDVCHDVEQQCPYFLPGDRAPAHPTQYAGEPTFLCLDPNIPETGEQRAKSSLGGDEDCCYTHCGSPGRGGGGGGGGGGALCYRNRTCSRHGNDNDRSPVSLTASSVYGDPPEPVRCTEMAPPSATVTTATTTTTTARTLACERARTNDNNDNINNNNHHHHVNKHNGIVATVVTAINSGAHRTVSDVCNSNWTVALLIMATVTMITTRSLTASDGGVNSVVVVVLVGGAVVVIVIYNNVATVVVLFLLLLLLYAIS